jgi:predicted secreted hydrolase
MLYRIRRRDGGAAPASEGTLVEADGSARRIAFEGVELTALGRWESPASGAVYPSRWRLTIPAEGLELTVEPRLQDQELNLAFRYWEGAVQVAGTSRGRPVSGQGYVELTGYGDDGD